MKRLAESVSSLDEMSHIIVQLPAIVVGLLPQTTKHHGYDPKEGVHKYGTNYKFHGSFMVVIGGTFFRCCIIISFSCCGDTRSPVPWCHIHFHESTDKNDTIFTISAIQYYKPPLIVLNSFHLRLFSFCIVYYHLKHLTNIQIGSTAISNIFTGD